MTVARTNVRRFVLVLLGALLIPIVPFAVIGELPGERWLSQSGNDALTFGATGAALLASDVLLPIPSSVIGSLLGGRLGLTAGFGWTFAGLCCGSIVGYGVGRLLPRRFASDVPEVPTLWVLFLSRPVPVFAEAVSIAAGAEHLAFAPFALASVPGNALYALAMAANGAALLPGGLAGPGLVVPMCVPVVAWLAWRAMTRRRTP